MQTTIKNNVIIHKVSKTKPESAKSVTNRSVLCMHRTTLITETSQV